MEKEIKEENLARLEGLYGELKMTKSLSETVWIKTDHGEGECCEMTDGEYDRLAALTFILYNRIYEAVTELNSIIENIYEEERNGK